MFFQLMVFWNSSWHFHTSWMSHLSPVLEILELVVHHYTLVEDKKGVVDSFTLISYDSCISYGHTPIY